MIKIIQYLKEKTMSKELNELKDRIKLLESEIARLENLLKHIKTDDRVEELKTSITELLANVQFYTYFNFKRRVPIKFAILGHLNKGEDNEKR